MTTKSPTRVWQQRRPRVPRPDVVVVGEQPLAQLLIYSTITLLTRREGAGWRQYPIDPDSLVDVVSKAPMSSGLLPPNTLAAGRVAGRPFFWAYVPPARRRLRLADERTFAIPVPPLIIGGWGQDYRIWALDREGYPSAPTQGLMVAPFPNCYTSGAICWGSSDPRPTATAANLLAVVDLFLEQSYFNLHLANARSVQFGQSVVARWEQLAESAATAYPLDDLMPAEASLGWALSGGPWRDIPARTHPDQPVYVHEPALDLADHEHEPWAAERPTARVLDPHADEDADEEAALLAAEEAYWEEEDEQELWDDD